MKGDPIRPYFETFHEFKASEKAYQQAAQNLLMAVRSCISICETPEQALAGLRELAKHADKLSDVS